MSCDVGEVTDLILQPFRNFTYVTAHSPTLPSLCLLHSLFFNPSVALPTSQLILQPFRRFTYVTAYSPTLPSLYLRHSSFSNPFVTSPTSQLILEPFFRFSYVTGSSLTSPRGVAHERKLWFLCVSARHILLLISHVVQDSVSFILFNIHNIH